MSNRLKNHPILEIPDKKAIPFYWNKTKYLALENEMLSSALIANGINIFGHHHKDDMAQGIFCANGQCAKCTVIANQVPVKACMTEVSENMSVQSSDGLPSLPEITHTIKFSPTETIETDVLVIGGGPSGLSAAIQLEKYKIRTILIDDKNELGGKLVLQTHKFFGSVEDSFAGTRGIDIGKKLAKQVLDSDHVQVWLNSTALYVFDDKKVGILKENKYILVKPKIILNAAGAREKFLRFAGNDLVGIYGAGAFQTLVNRDLVKSSQRLFIIGGGNVGLIAGYHALQAGIEVVGLVEAMPDCGGYMVHADKLKRLGVPVYNSHSIVSANGKEKVESITIAEIDKNFQHIPGTEKSFACDTILIAVGLESLSEFTEEAITAGVKVFAAGDAHEIAEASSAMFHGKIMGLTIASEMGADAPGIPDEWLQKAKILKSHPRMPICLPLHPFTRAVQEIRDISNSSQNYDLRRRLYYLRRMYNANVLQTAEGNSTSGQHKCVPTESGQHECVPTESGQHECVPTESGQHKCVPTESGQHKCVPTEPPLAKGGKGVVDEKFLNPLFHCLQEIPCNPCTTVCPTKSIHIGKKDSTSLEEKLMGLPYFEGNCIGCGQCLFVCPGLSVSLIEFGSNPDCPTVWLPYEICNIFIKEGDEIELVDIVASSLGKFKVKEVKTNKIAKTQIIKVELPLQKAVKAIAFKIQPDEVSRALEKVIMPEKIDENTMICLCERINAATVISLIKKGITDINHIKAITRMCMGPCGAKSCDVLIRQVFRQEGVPLENVVPNTRRPFFVEIPVRIMDNG